MTLGRHTLYKYVCTTHVVMTQQRTVIGYYYNISLMLFIQQLSWYHSLTTHNFSWPSEGAPRVGGCELLGSNWGH